MQELVKTGKYTEINKQSDVKCWLNWINYGAVSYSLNCTWVNLNSELQLSSQSKYRPFHKICCRQNRRMAMFGQNLTIPAIVKVAKPARLLWELLSREQQEVKKMARDLTHRPAKTSNLLRLFRMQQKWKKNCSRQTADYYYESLQFDEKESLSRDFPNFLYLSQYFLSNYILTLFLCLLS